MNKQSKFKTETLNKLDDKIGKTLEFISVGKDFLSRTPIRNNINNQNSQKKQNKWPTNAQKITQHPWQLQKCKLKQLRISSYSTPKRMTAIPKSYSNKCCRDCSSILLV